MKRTLQTALLVFGLILGPALADPNPQLVSLVKLGLSQYGLTAPVEDFATSTVAALHLKLSQPEDYMSTRRELKAILRRAKYK